MWRQLKAGYYTDGKNSLTVDYFSCNNFYVSKNEEFTESFESVKKLNEYLYNLGLESLYVPKNVNLFDTWFTFESINEMEKKKVFSKKNRDGKIETVMVVKFSDEDFSVYMRESCYSCLECLITETLDFVEDMGRNPINDLEVDVYEICKHGSSGMDKIHADLKSKEEVKEILKNVYNINYFEN